MSVSILAPEMFSGVLRLVQGGFLAHWCSYGAVVVWKLSDLNESPDLFLRFLSKSN